MAYMDFIILKVNGTDVSNSPHADAVRAFLAAQDPIVVEVKRRISTVKQLSSNSEGCDAPGDSNTTQMERSNLVSTAVQTDIMACSGWLDESPISEHNNGFEECLAPEIDLEEVTLRKCSSDERLGLTVCYSSGTTSGSDEADGNTPSTEVYISDIVPESVAGRDGRLRQGDQILQVNGRDVANKEETESLFAENRNAVTLLVSRCLYQDEEYLDGADYYAGLPSDFRSVAYQNSLIEQLIQQQTMEPTFRGATLDPGTNQAPKVPSHASPEHSLPEHASNINIKTHLESVNQEITLLDHRMENVLLNRTTQQLQGNSNQLDNVNHDVLLLDQRMENINLSKKVDKRRPPQLPVIPAPPESDTEHIYETIPETENETEPIYSSPYEADDQNIVQQWLKKQGCSWQNKKEPANKYNANWKKTSKSNSSGEDHENSSSAYNTGGSCNSNPLTLELTFNTDSRDKAAHRSTLVLCAPPIPEDPGTTEQTAVDGPCKQCTRHRKTCSPKHSPKQNSKTASPVSPSPAHEARSAHTVPVNTPASPGETRVTETMYTDMANLQQTMLLQQQLFRQALIQNNSTYRNSADAMRLPANFKAPSLSQYQFVSSQQMYNSCLEPVCSSDVRMEWKVKRRQDGTRYIARRPVRNRLLKDRALKISEERTGFTTEDDTMSEIKIGRYWTKEERKKQVERSRERRHRQETIISSKNQQLDDMRQDKSNHSPKGFVVDKTNIAANSKKAPNTDVHKKTLRKKNNNKEDFTTVQEMLHGNKVPSGGKVMGLLSVTTV